jgi:uncharacterized membrane protein (TIGR02234 family)
VSGGRVKSLALVTGLLGAGLALLAWSQTWFELHLVGQSGPSAGAIEVGGGIASPALAALGLAGLALVAAIAIAGPLMRILLAVLQVLLGGSIVLAAALALGDPVGAVAPAVTEATGVAGAAPTAELVASADPTLWPAAAIAGGGLVVLAGIAALVTTRRWPGSSRRYSAVRTADADAEAPPSPEAAAVPRTDERRKASDRAVDAWDELSRGDDPTGHDDLGRRDDEPQARREGPVDPSR